jgi:hypothetical protein
VEAYQGQHQLIINHNEKNLGIGHFNKLMELSSGKLVIIAHGDDLSLPDRVSKIVAAWQATGVSMVTSNATLMDRSGRFIGLAVGQGETPDNSLLALARSGWNPSLWGAVLAWTRDVFDIFGGIDPEKSAVTTDWILPFRAALLNGIHYIDEPLVHIRQHKRQKQRVYISGDDNREIVREYTEANHLIQRLYMLETLYQEESLNLQPRETIIQARSDLSNCILSNARHWRTLRNQLLNQRLRPHWQAIDW